ncbi:MAG: SemiSWEET transporter [Candidatus Aenigmarchaeota archaeon]|nr:SemiSWEET transporter [Candidatus Aenigmarchaeota archaeon]
MDYVSILGFIAGAMTTGALIPQVIHTWISKSTKDVSLGMYIVFVAGILLWIVYGNLIKSLPIIIVNIVSFCLASTILILKIKYK